MSLLTSKLSDEDRKKAHELFGVPEQFDEVADLMVHEEEWQVILLMGKEPMTEKELRKLMEKNRLAIKRDCAQAGLRPSAAIRPP